MTEHETSQAMGVIEKQNDGSEARALIVEALKEKLIKDPDSFWNYYIDVMNESAGDPFGALAEQLLRTGKVTDNTTYGELYKILAAEAADVEEAA
jgi:hypothetical protein